MPSRAFHRKLAALYCPPHLEWDYVPANLLTQARWFSYVAFSGKQMGFLLFDAPDLSDLGAANAQ